MCVGCGETLWINSELTEIQFICFQYNILKSFSRRLVKTNFGVIDYGYVISLNDVFISNYSNYFYSFAAKTLTIIKHLNFRPYSVIVYKLSVYSISFINLQLKFYHVYHSKCILT